MKYLFVTGCPRSGTTALAQLLNSHPQIAIGIERYGNRFFGRHFLDRSLFERDRFFDLQAGDTFWPALDAPVWSQLREKWDHASYIGDKIPFLYRYLDQLDAAFGDDLRVLMIVRQIEPIAASYERRRSDPADTTWNGHDAMDAVQHWKQSLEAAVSRFGDPRYSVVSHADLFEHGIGLAAMFGALGLPITESVSVHYAGQLRRSQQLAGERVGLDVETLEDVQAAAPHELYERVLRQSLTSAVRLSSPRCT